MGEFLEIIKCVGLFAAGCMFYAKVLDKPEVKNYFKKFKQKRTIGSDQVINNEYTTDFDNPKAIGRINGDMTRREVLKVWKSLKKL
jgi:hemoglobin-like flavoprotein